MPHPLPFVNLDAQYLSDLADRFDEKLNGPHGDLAAARSLRLRRIAENLESMDQKLRHGGAVRLPKKSED